MLKKGLYLVVVLRLGCGYMSKIESVLEKKRTKILIFIIFDIIMLFFSSIFAIGIRYDFDAIPLRYYIGAYQFIYIDIIFMLIIFTIFRLYTSVWK